MPACRMMSEHNSLPPSAPFFAILFACPCCFCFVHKAIQQALHFYNSPVTCRCQIFVCSFVSFYLDCTYLAEIIPVSDATVMEGKSVKA